MRLSVQLRLLSGRSLPLTGGPLSSAGTIMCVLHALTHSHADTACWADVHCSEKGCADGWSMRECSADYVDSTSSITVASIMLCCSKTTAEGGPFSGALGKYSLFLLAGQLKHALTPVLSWGQLPDAMLCAPGRAAQCHAIIRARIGACATMTMLPFILLSLY